MTKIQPKVQGDERDDGLRERAIAVNRMTKMAKGDQIFGLAALVVASDGDGHIDMGKGRTKKVPVAVQKAMDEARRRMVKVPPKNDVLQHEMIGEYGATKVQIIPAKDDTGMIAGDPMCAISEVTGVANIMAKSRGSTNPYNMVRATLDGLRRMGTSTEVAAKHGKSVEEILG